MLVLELDADFDDVGVADGVDPERQPICRVISSERIWSRIEKNGFGRRGG
jgi:hypothetical protein